MGELPTLVCPIDVITKPRKRGSLAHLGLWPHEKKKSFDKGNVYIVCQQKGIKAKKTSSEIWFSTNQKFVSVKYCLKPNNFPAIWLQGKWPPNFLLK